MKKRFLYLFFSTILVILVAWNPFSVSGAEKEMSVTYSAQFSLFSGNTEVHVPVRITENDTAGMRFRAETEFYALQVCCPSYGNAVGSLTFTLYPWKETVEKSREGTPIATETFTDFADNAQLTLSFSPQKPGEYYWELRNGTEMVGVWKCPETAKNVSAFLNGQPVDGAYECRVEGYGAKIPFSGSPKLYEKLTAETISPPETDCVSETDGILTAEKFQERDLFPDTWDAVDGLGRKLGDMESLTAPRKKLVGIFYWTWHEGGTVQDDPNNIPKILAKYPGILKRPQDPTWGKVYERHHWDEPIFGYYRTTDKWVLRRHAQLLNAAGVDAVIFDATNGTLTWMDSTYALLETWAEMRKDGFRTPKFAFMLPFGTQKHLRDSLLQLYRDIYRPGKYRDQWFYWGGRPIIHAEPQVIADAVEDMSATPEERRDWEEILRFFTFRPLQPGYAVGPKSPNQWCWLEVFPQHAWGAKSDGTYEMAGAGIAQNHTWGGTDGHVGLAAMNDQNVFGRAYIGPTETELRPGEMLRFAENRNPKREEPNRFLWGENFAQQLERAQEIDPDYLFITGWNEWSASRFLNWMGTENAFPDQFSPEFSRDAEPSRGVLKDHFYYQLVQGIRRFRGVRPQRAADENPIYRDARNDTLPRASAGYGSTFYENRTGRNDFTDCFVTHDAENIYFTAECASPITPSDGKCWMRLFVSVTLEEGRGPHWEHYQYVVNRKNPEMSENPENGMAILEKCAKDGWNWTEIGRIPINVAQNRLTLTVPRRLLEQDGKKIDVRFKWADNTALSNVPEGKTEQESDILTFYENGDVAPDGRFMYRYFER